MNKQELENEEVRQEEKKAKKKKVRKKKTMLGHIRSIISILLVWESSEEATGITHSSTEPRWSRRQTGR